MEFRIISIIFFFFGLSSLKINAQSNVQQTKVNKEINEEEVVLKLENQKDETSSNSNSKVPLIGAEFTPSPIQQGFIKYSAHNWDYYYKEEGQLQIIYTPK